MNSIALPALNQLTRAGCMGDGTGLIIAFAMMAEIGLMFLAALILGCVLARRTSGKLAIVAWLLVLPGTLAATVAEGALVSVLATFLDVATPIVGLVPIVAAVVAAFRLYSTDPPSKAPPVLDSDAPILRGPND